MAQSCLRYITLEVNCGFSRTAIRELTNRNKRSRNDIDTPTRALEFQKLFKDCPKYCQNGSVVDTMTMVHSLIVTVKKSFYTFTRSGIPKNLRLTMKNNFQLKTGRPCLCTKRRVMQWPNVKHEYYHHQQKYPQGPHFDPVPIVSVDVQELHRLGKAKGTRKVLVEMYDSFSNVFNVSFTSSLVKHGKEPIHMKPTPNERKKS